MTKFERFFFSLTINENDIYSLIDPTNRTIDPIKEYKKLSDDENLRFQMELEEIQEKFDKLDQRRFSNLFIDVHL